MDSCEHQRRVRPLLGRCGFVGVETIGLAEEAVFLVQPKYALGQISESEPLRMGEKVDLPRGHSAIAGAGA
jgi:hypothetical protein